MYNTAEECFELGLIAYSNDDAYHALCWMKEALDRLLVNGNKNIAFHAKVLEYYSCLLEDVRVKNKVLYTEVSEYYSYYLRKLVLKYTVVYF